VVRRLPYSRPVLPEGRQSTLAVIAAGVDSPEIYVSYAWGEDSTPDGQRREEIVDRLCDTVRASGRKIGRDKERMRAGDSIERFAHEISKAARIIAVVSEKSLHSDFCMAQELFRAYRRCDYQRPEFQEKVIALVMDDAKPFLADDFVVLALAEHWRGKFEKLQKGLVAIDPTRKNHELWVFVDLMEEMIPRLPGMLAALRDVIMKRGFDAIVADNFREVLARLPPP
jgi:TIR domain